jgi:hypothetical protein
VNILTLYVCIRIFLWPKPLLKTDSLSTCLFTHHNPRMNLNLNSNWKVEMWNSIGQWRLSNTKTCIS